MLPCTRPLSRIVCIGVALWTSPAHATYSWQPRLDSFQFALVNHAKQRVVLGSDPTEYIGVAITLTAMEDITFPKENYLLPLLGGVPYLNEKRFGRLAWDSFQVLIDLRADYDVVHYCAQTSIRRMPTSGSTVQLLYFQGSFVGELCARSSSATARRKLGSLDDAGLQVMNAFAAKKSRGIYVLSPKRGRMIEKGKRVTLILAARVPKGLAPNAAANEFTFTLPSYDPVEVPFPSEHLNLELKKKGGNRG